MIHLLSVVALCLVSTGTSAYPRFQEEIPNGKNVPHPCVEGTMWQGVGHENPLGAGTRNPFGRDFDANGFKWNATLCRKDSDQDGKTNGEELGDPNCTWIVGAVPEITTGITHPGVCEPLGSQTCMDKNSFVDCTNTSFNCPAISEPGVFVHEVRIPMTQVPAEETTYMCMTFEFPSDKEYHMIASDPIIDNMEVMHHTVVFGCTGDVSGQLPAIGVPKKCNDMSACQHVVAVWSAGGIGKCLNENMGFLVGGTSGFKYGVIQQHWNNPMLRSHYKDSSGFKFYVTPNLRPNNAGVLTIGQTYLAIPPNALGHVEEGSCTSECMEEVMTGDIYVTNTFNHMHLLGKTQITELRRDGSLEKYLAYDDVYDYNSPVVHSYGNQAIKVSPGDELKTTCVFQSRGREKTTNFGQATQDEMCLSFITYYPKENFNTGRCTAWKSLDYCEVERRNVKRGCDFQQLLDVNNTKTMKIVSSVTSKCTPFVCRQECLDTVRRLKADPCFRGDVGYLARMFSLYRGSEDKKAAMRIWYTKLDSCDWELFQEGYTRQGDSGISSSATWTTFSIFSVTLIAALFSVLF